uniref:Uncharacterized protein n=1 Tax=Knipowitschia caucasica TaxID=637954 RepID=A0AAV2IY89_KNICA
MTREIGCQTDPVIARHASVQANVKPSRRSKAIQARSAYTSVSSGTEDLMDITLPDCPRAASTPLKRKRCEVPASDPSFHIDDSASTVNCSSLPVPTRASGWGRVKGVAQPKYSSV